MLWECDGGIGNGVRILIRRGEKTQKKGWGGIKISLGLQRRGYRFSRPRLFESNGDGRGDGDWDGDGREDEHREGDAKE